MAGAMASEVRLGRGRHRSAQQGTCVMELASVLAGERFSDRPRCVDPVLAAYLRAFNDRLGHHRRQELVAYAAAAVGTRGDRRVTRARVRRCLAFAGGGRRPRFARLRVAVLIGLTPALVLRTGAAEWAAREAVVRDDEIGFALLDALLADGGVASPRAVAPRERAAATAARREPVPA